MDRPTTLFLCGDLMTGRGIDQILARPSEPQLYEPFVRSALGYVELAESASGPIARRVDDAYIWGDALAELDRLRPAARIVNLETAITASEDAWPGKSINYRMHPANIGCLTAGAIDCCVLANNHVLDWGYGGLSDTVAALRAAGIGTAGAGENAEQACAPAIINAGARRVIIFAFGSPTAGVPAEWAARADRAGVNWLDRVDAATARAIGERVGACKRRGDIAVVSLHWGGNWGCRVPRAQRDFARMLIDDAGVDIVYGHSSHHPKGIEIHRGRPILYGCGDFLNDYEGIGGYEAFRAELGVMYLPSFDAEGALRELALVPTRIRHLRVNRAHGSDVDWLATMLGRESAVFGTRVERRADETLIAHAP